jgi:hypothetical protein
MTEIDLNFGALAPVADEIDLVAEAALLHGISSGMAALQATA